MGIKKFNPITPTLRYRTVSDFAEITTSKPEKSLLESKHRTGGRNNLGRMTTRHKGGGHKRLYRVVDFKRKKHGVAAKVVSIEYDPNRTSRVALLHYLDGEKSYIIAPNDLKVGDTVLAGPEADIKPGNALPLEKIPVGTMVHNIELVSGKGAQMVRSAGSFAQLMAKDGHYATLRLPNTASAADDAKKPKKTIDEKRADFGRLASGRVSRAIDALSALQHLSNTSSYDWSDEAQVKIFETLREKIDTVEASFAAAKAPSEGNKKTARALSFRV